MCHRKQTYKYFKGLKRKMAFPVWLCNLWEEGSDYKHAAHKLSFNPVAEDL